MGCLPVGDYRILINPIATSSQQLIHATSGGVGAVNWTTGRSYWNNGGDPYPLPDYEFVFGVIGTERPLVPTSTVPEPATMTLLASGMVGLAAARRRRQG